MAKKISSIEAAILKCIAENGGSIGPSVRLPAATGVKVKQLALIPVEQTPVSYTETHWELFIADWTPPSINKLIGANRYVANKIKKDAYDRLAKGLFDSKVRIPPATRKRRLFLTLTIPNMSRAGDPDNFSKCVRDWLVLRGFLVDDSAQWCEGKEPVIQKGKKSTLIVLEDIFDELSPTG